MLPGVEFFLLDPLEDLGADDVSAEDFHRLDDLVVLELSHDPGGLLALLLGRLLRDELVAVLSDDGLDLATVRGRLLKLLPDFKLQLHGFQGGGGFDTPFAFILSHLKLNINKK